MKYLVVSDSQRGHVTLLELWVTNLAQTGVGRTCRSIKSLDMERYNWSRLSMADVLNLAQDIFHEDFHLKDTLRRGVWMHLLRIFHPSLTTQAGREQYIAKLRRVYDNLKGKWLSDSSPEVHSLCESVRRDALRTDPTEEFYSMQSRDNNVEKLINITVVYTLEHPGVSYTQGMTDLLSPLLYVMKREDDAYICFAAMLERLQGNFTAWCDGALKKVERLRHLCEVLDPELYQHLTHNIQEDTFALLFGMILIDCRREFSFQDSFHLYEVLMASCISEVTTDATLSEWAQFLSRGSQEDVIKLVFGEAAGPYSAQPLGRTDSTEALVTEEVHMTPDEQFGGARNGGRVESKQLATKLQEVSYTLEQPVPVPRPVAIPSNAPSSEARHSATAEMSEISSLESRTCSPRRSQSAQAVEVPASNQHRPGSCGIPAQHQATSDTSRSKSPLSDPTHPCLHSDDLGGMRIPGSAGNSGHLFSYPILSSFSKGGVHQLSTSFPRDRPFTNNADNSMAIMSHEAILAPVSINGHDDHRGIISQLVSTEQAVPDVTRRSSLSIPIQDCFSLFVCMALLVQNRTTILRRQLDFIGLSMLLNSQCGSQNLTKTLTVARHLLLEYQKYQQWFGRTNTWLDSSSDSDQD